MHLLGGRDEGPQSGNVHVHAPNVGSTSARCQSARNSCWTSRAARRLPRSMTNEARQPSEDVFQRLLSQRIVFLGQEVDDAIANRLCAEILLLSAEDRHRDIHLYINSPGGSVTAGMAIYDVMQFVPNDVATLSLGFTASMGQFLLCAGAPGKRYALPHTRIVMHQPSGGIGGTASDIRIQAANLLTTKRQMQQLIAAHTGQSVARIEADSDRDHFFTAQEALDYGFVDHVVDTAQAIPAAA
ncbi:ClpP family protease [Actinomadura rupiterrae]|uniref:ClpP family protease n=1 Tax=Actinomadura rupiterrae TaxID=559627 RepID=UPI0026467277|nr:ATP-dependent Clp protease proteolytic subunit [Actinomadura rupiterrae]